MTRRTEKTDLLNRLKDVLDIYGAGMERWPADDRERLADLIEKDRVARELLGESKGLESVMAFAPAGEASGQLRDRIVAAALTASGQDKPAVSVPAMPSLWERILPGADVLWPGAALAASFAIGLILGIAGLGTGAVNQAVDYASITGMVEGVESGDLLLDVQAGDQEGLL